MDNQTQRNMPNEFQLNEYAFWYRNPLDTIYIRKQSNREANSSEGNTEMNLGPKNVGYSNFVLG